MKKKLWNTDEFHQNRIWECRGVIRMSENVLLDSYWVLHSIENDSARFLQVFQKFFFSYPFNAGGYELLHFCELSIGEVFRAIPALCREVGANLCH